MRVTLVALNAMYPHTNLAVRMLHAAVRRADVPVTHSVVELHINQPLEAQLRAVWETALDVAAFSVYIWNVEAVLRLSRALCGALPGLRVVLGGPEVSFDAQARLDAHPHLSAIVCGEGEESYPALLGAWARGEVPRVPGVCARGAEAAWLPAQSVPPERWIDPYADGLGMAGEGEPAPDVRRIWYAETSRGCPFQCQFCLSSREAGVRALPAEQAIARLTALAARGVPLVKLVDRTFNYDPARARAIWAALMALDTRCVFHFEVEAHLLGEADLALLAQAPPGRFQFEIGVQSTTPAALRAVRRGDHFPAIAHAVHRLREAGNIALHLDLIAGLPGEDGAGFARSFDDVYALRPHMLQLGFLKLLPGSGLRRDAEALGLVYAPDPPYPVLRTAQMSHADIQHLWDVETVHDWYGNSGRFVASVRLLTWARSPFAAFSALAQDVRARGALEGGRSQAQRVELLWAHACALWGGQDATDEQRVRLCAMAQALRFDALCAGFMPGQLPEALQDALDEAERARDADTLRALVPEAAARRGCVLARFTWDVLALREAGTLTETPCRLLIDRRRGTVTRVEDDPA